MSQHKMSSSLHKVRFILNINVYNPVKTDIFLYKCLCTINDMLWVTVLVFYRYLLIENFIPPEEKNKIMNRLYFDSEEDQWRLQPVLPSERSVY